MIALPDLYNHQQDIRDRTRAALAKHGRVILCGGCGTGKTRISKAILGASLNRTVGERASGRSLFVVQGRPLVRNASESFSESPELPHGVIMSGEDTDYGKRVQVASIDTVLSWLLQGNQYPSKMTFDLVIHDEADSHFTKFAKFLKHHDARRAELGLHRAYGIGLTATPKATGLADVYKEIVMGPTTEWLIENGYLSPFRYFGATEGKLGLLVKRGDRFTSDSEAEAMDGLAGDLVRDWKEFGQGRPTVGFFPRRKHAKDAMEKLQAAGLRVEYVDADTPDEERWSAYRALDKHYIDYLCNVNLVGRGTDIPAISCVQLCVAMASVKDYLQKVGRGSRFHPDKYPAKKDCVVIDHGGSVRRLGLFEDERHWTLDITTKDCGDNKIRPTIKCPRCKAVYRGGLCRNCGYEPRREERKAQGLDFDGRELVEVTREKKKPAVKTPEELFVKALYIAGKLNKNWRTACGTFYKHLNEQQGTNYSVPATFEVNGRRYRSVRRDSGDDGRSVSILYPFTVKRGNHGGEFLVEETETAETPY